MRISDWSSDVCSSDLMRFGPSGADRLLAAPGRSQSPPTPTPGEAHAGWRRSRRTAMRQTGKRRARREDGGAKPPAPRTNLYDEVTHRIVAELEAGRGRQSGVEGKRVSVRVALGGRRLIKTKNYRQHTELQQHTEPYSR